MRRTLFAIAFLWTASLSAQSEAEKKAPDTSTLSRAEKTVINYLAKDWEKEYRTSSITVAAEATKVKLSDASRLRLAKFIEANRMSYRAPARHRTTTIALSPTEKLIARSILLLEAQGNEAAPIAPLAGRGEGPFFSWKHKAMKQLGLTRLQR